MKYPEISQKLAKMAELDQAMRMDSQKGLRKFDTKLDIVNTIKLKAIIGQIKCWPSIDLVGEEASYAAWLIAQHADHDLEFQAMCLDLMNKNRKNVLPINIAYLTDRIAVNGGRPQTYGTQFYMDESGELVPRPIKERQKLDILRKEMGLEPFETYELKMKGKYRWPKGYQNQKIGRLFKVT